MPLLKNRRSYSASRSRRRVNRPALEALEGRVVMATSPLDPTFGQMGAVLGPLMTSDDSGATAVAVQPDGKIVTAGETHTAATGAASVVICRYDANGAVDSTFGSGGTVTIATPYKGGLPRNVAFDASGRIVLAVDESTGIATGSTTPAAQSLVIRLTPAGQLDPTFGTGGEYAITLQDAVFDHVAVEYDGKVVLAGTTTVAGTATPETQITVIRLTTAGTLDTTFNSTGVLTTLPGSIVAAGSNEVEAVALAPTARNPSGQIVIAATLNYVPATVGGGARQTIVAQLNTDGTPDTSFGTGGIVDTPFLELDDMAVESTASNQIVLVGQVAPATGYIAGSYGLIRLNSNGAVDSSFQASATVTPTSTTTTTTTTTTDTGTTTTVTTRQLQRIVLGDGPNPEITVAGVSHGSQLSTTGMGANNIGLSSFLVERFLATGAPDTAFGTNGSSTFFFTPEPTSAEISQGSILTDLALASGGKVVVVGSAESGATSIDLTTTASQSVLAQVLASPVTIGLPIEVHHTVAGDYDGDERSDFAAELATFGLFAVRQSSNSHDVVTSFGPAGLGQAIPAPGDYDGDGKTDLAAYLPAYGVLAYRPSSGGADVVVPFGIAGVGQSIPAPGDYDGDGKTDVAVYMPALGILAYRPSSGGADVLTPFGTAGAGNSIPAPGDYDGDGKTDVAVYLPAYGVLAYRPSSGGADVLTQFGVAGLGQTIPAPGDYDGDGKTDIAAYFPASGLFAYRPSAGGANVIESFGVAGLGASAPVPGDYDGDGKTDVAVYVPAEALFAYRPSAGGADVVESFGISGVGQTVPATVVPEPMPTTTAAPISAQAVASLIPQDTAATDLLTSPTARKKARLHHA